MFYDILYVNNEDEDRKSTIIKLSQILLNICRETLPNF